MLIFFALFAIFSCTKALRSVIVCGDGDKNFCVKEKIVEATERMVDQQYISLANISRDHLVEYQDLTEIDNPNDVKKKEFGDIAYAFNIVVSDRIGVSREVPDTRRPSCKGILYPEVEELPSASIVIVYHNEALSVLIRMINSILTRTPLVLIHEIILLDDFSDENLKIVDFLLEYHNENPKWYNTGRIRFFHTESRKGLIRAKNIGANLASGDVLIFLDSHCEVNVGWIEPLLTEILRDPKVVVCPIVDIIDPKSLNYSESTIAKGGFNWAMTFEWFYFPWDNYNIEETYINPYKSPAMSGGLFALRKSYFHELGNYDGQMEIWGGENIEMSLRIWMCGGTLKIVPCSRVGHLFRYVKPYSQPSKFAQDTFMTNSLRTAHVWMDGYIEKFFERRPHTKDMEFGDISDRVELRKRLKCQSFQWYIDNVYPELIAGYPTM